MRGWFAYSIVVLSLVLGVATLALAARDSPPTHPSTAQTETLGGIALTDGWCVSTNGTTNLDLGATAPARVTSSIKNSVRFIGIKFVAGATSTRVCHRMGGTLVALACDALDTDAAGVLSDGQSATYSIARDFTAGGLPTLSAQANAGVDGSVCVTIGW